MQTQSHGQHARTEAHVVVSPIRWAAAVMQSGHVAAYPDSNIRRHIDASRIRIWFVLIDGRCPVNRDAAQNKAEKDRHIQPVTPPHQKMMLLGHEHAGLFHQRARRVRFTGRKCWIAHWPESLLLSVGRHRWSDYKDLVRGKRSVRQLVRR